jgi:hypothetical protein
VAWLLERLRLRASWPVYGALTATVLAGVASLATWRTVTIDGIGHINDTHGMISKWLKAHTPPNASIAAFDIGRISYDWQNGITDLGGLVDPSYYPYLVEGRVPQYLEARHIQYLVLPGDGTEGFGFQTHPIAMTKVAEYCSPKDPWLIGFRYTIHATRCQELYRLDPGPALQEAKSTSTPGSAAIGTKPTQKQP